MIIDTPSWISGCVERSRSSWAPARGWGGRPPARSPGGCDLALAARKATPLGEAAEAIVKECGVKVFHQACDVTRDADRESFLAETLHRYGRVDSSSTTAAGPKPATLKDAPSAKDWQDAFERSLLQVVKWTQAVVPYMKGWGRIVNIVSTSVRQPIDGLLLSNSIRPGVIGLLEERGARAGAAGDHDQQHPARLDPDRPDGRARRGALVEGGHLDGARARGEGARDSPRGGSGSPTRSRGGRVPLLEAGGLHHGRRPGRRRRPDSRSLKSLFNPRGRMNNCGSTHRERTMKRLMLATLALVLCVLPGVAADPVRDGISVYIGSYAKDSEPGIHHFKLDFASGALTAAGGTSGVANPSFVAISPDKKHLYAIGETGGKKGGAVVSFSIDDKGALTKLSEGSSVGSGPCYVTTDKTGQGRARGRQLRRRLGRVAAR
jgi:3-oxoacyl-[acyl-carrier protein] reductase